MILLGMCDTARPALRSSGRCGRVTVSGGLAWGSCELAPAGWFLQERSTVVLHAVGCIAVPCKLQADSSEKTYMYGSKYHAGVVVH